MYAHIFDSEGPQFQANHVFRMLVYFIYAVSSFDKSYLIWLMHIFRIQMTPTYKRTHTVTHTYLSLAYIIYLSLTLTDLGLRPYNVVGDAFWYDKYPIKTAAIAAAATTTTAIYNNSNIQQLLLKNVSHELWVYL